MIQRVASSIFRRLDLPFLQTEEWILLRELRKKLEGIPRYVHGEVSINDWKIEYVDTLSLISSIEIVVLKRWNDFTPSNNNPVILDCGANIGIATLHYKKLFPNSQIIAFEPDHEVCEVMKRNLDRNKIKDVEVIEAAVWKEDGELEFFAEGSDAGRLNKNSEDDLGNLVITNPKANFYPVKTIRLADFLAKSNVDFIKMDIEGAEYEVIADCGTLLKNVNSMVIECHFTNNRPHELANILTVLSDVGFSIAVNSYGQWIDLSNKHTIERNNVGYDQYFLVSAWRN